MTTQPPPSPAVALGATAFPPVGDVVTQHEDPHTRGEFVYGLGWSCIDCDTFYCPVVNAPAGGCVVSAEQPIPPSTYPPLGDVVTQLKCSPGNCHCRADADCGKPVPLDYPGLADTHPCILCVGHAGPCYAVVPNV